MSRAGISPSAEPLHAPERSSGSSTPSRTDGGRHRAVGGVGNRGLRVVRWTLWLIAGIVFGVSVGFLAGLSRPQHPARRFEADPTGMHEPGGAGA